METTKIGFSEFRGLYIFLGAHRDIIPQLWRLKWQKEWKMKWKLGLYGGLWGSGFPNIRCTFFFGRGEGGGP